MTEKVTARELAKDANVSLAWIYNNLWTGKLPGEKVRGKWFINREDADAFHEKRRARLGADGGK